jgi:hypothetical protein
MEAVRSSETSVNFYRTTKRHIVLEKVTNISEEPDASTFYPEQGGSRFIRIVGTYLHDYTASHPRRESDLHFHRCENLTSLKRDVRLALDGERVGVVLASYWRGARFESRPGHQLPWLKCFVVSFSTHKIKLIIVTAATSINLSFQMIYWLFLY